MQFLKKFFQNKNKLSGSPFAVSEHHEPSRLNTERGINFSIYKASGGTIVETRTYDRVQDRHFNNLYVITDDKDLGVEIGKIITLTSLRS